MNKRNSKQNLTRDIDIKNNLSVTRGEVGEENGFKGGKGCQGTYINNTWTKPKGGRIKGGTWGWVGQGDMVGRKWRQLYLNDNKKKKKE